MCRIAQSEQWLFYWLDNWWTVVWFLAWTSVVSSLLPSVLWYYHYLEFLMLCSFPVRKVTWTLIRFQWIDFSLQVFHIANGNLGTITQLSISCPICLRVCVLYLIFRLYGNPFKRRAQFTPSSVHAEFVVNKVTKTGLSLSTSDIFCQLSFHQRSVFIHLLSRPIQ